ncbi:bZIP transcription factor 53-like [Rutidosis leptorrhynchoides]|uniref:bZIP transcription factor 53-like n=1 Tax=Rutidosis leptorrhynchoides TaxID=125765 RepID=UPI003A991B67
MASPNSSSETRYANLDERKRKRMISNRESARRSRAKKQNRLDELLSEINQLQNDNTTIMKKIDGATQILVGANSQNNVLRAQLTELTDRLHSLNSVLHIAQEVSGLAMDIPEMPDTLLEPWKLPCSIQPITAASFDMSMF